jgi:uncharacterized protein YcbX
MLLGEVLWLHRYPVKSLVGEALDQIDVTPRGLAHDRTHALLDIETGRIASAKRPQNWRSLLCLSSRRADGDFTVVYFRSITGEERSSEDPDIDRWLSNAIGRKVRLIEARSEGLELERSRPEEALARGVEAEVTNDIIVLGQAAPQGGFFDFAPVHVVFASSLRRIAELASLGGLEESRYRPNVVIEDIHATAFEERHWVGRKLALGEVELTLIHPTPRCAIPTLAQMGLAWRPQVLRAIAASNIAEFLDMGPQPCLGLYAEVETRGRIKIGDAARLA